jgi:hypothetical protein
MSDTFKERTKGMKLSGLWSSVDANGNIYLHGGSGDIYFTVTKNQFKGEDDNFKPDYILYIHNDVDKRRKKSDDESKGVD